MRSKLLLFTAELLLFTAGLAWLFYLVGGAAFSARHWAVFGAACLLELSGRMAEARYQHKSKYICPDCGFES